MRTLCLRCVEVLLESRLNAPEHAHKLLMAAAFDGVVLISTELRDQGLQSFEVGLEFVVRRARLPRSAVLARQSPALAGRKEGCAS